MEKEFVNFLKFPIVDAAVSGWFILDGKKYEMDQFKIGFSQEVDQKGEPQHETNGGQMMITLSSTVSESVYDWAIKSGRRKDGEIIFKNESTNSPMRILFFNAACINLNRRVNYSGGLETHLVISPERLTMNDMEHDNFWKE